jgi:hypothetical protein
MKKMIAMFAIAASVAACGEATEEVVVEETTVDTTAVVDSTSLEEVEDAAYEAEAAAE